MKQGTVSQDGTRESGAKVLHTIFFSYQAPSLLVMICSATTRRYSLGSDVLHAISLHSHAHDEFSPTEALFFAGELCFQKIRIDVDVYYDTLVLCCECGLHIMQGTANFGSAGQTILFCSHCKLHTSPLYTHGICC